MMRGWSLLVLFALVILAGGVATDAEAERLGRLFMSAEERAALDEIRHQAGIERLQPEPEPVAVPEPRPQPVQQPVTPSGPAISRLVINGVVRRHRGPASVWVNGDLLEGGGTSREGVAVESARGAAGSVRLRLPSGAGTVALRPGQQIDVDSGALMEAYDTRAPAAGNSAFGGVVPARDPVPSASDQAPPPVPVDAPAPAQTPAAVPPGAAVDPEAARRVLEELADPRAAGTAEEKAAIEDFRRRVERSVAGATPAKP